MPLAIELPAVDVCVVPGVPTAFVVAVTNIGFRPEAASLVVDDPLRPYSVVHGADLRLAPGARVDVTVELFVPRSTSANPGAWPLVVRAVPHDPAREAALAEATVRVAEFADRRVALVPARAVRRRGAAFTVVVENRGNVRTVNQIRLVDRSGRLVGRVTPPALSVPPGVTAIAGLEARFVRRRWRRSRRVDFQLHISDPTAAPSVLDASVLQPPLLSLMSLTAAGATMILMAGAYFGLVRGAVTDAVAVARTRTTPAPSSTVASDAAAPTTSDSSLRLAVRAPLGSTDVESFPIEDGTKFEITDLLIQNPDAAAGRLVILRSAEVLYETALGGIGDLPYSFVSPLTFAGGSTLSVQLDCSASPSSECLAAVTFSGRTVRGPSTSG